MVSVVQGAFGVRRNAPLLVNPAHHPSNVEGQGLSANHYTE